MRILSSIHQKMENFDNFERALLEVIPNNFVTIVVCPNQLEGFDLTGIRIKGINANRINVAPLLRELINIWFVQCHGMSYDSMKKLHYDLFQCAKRLWEEQNLERPQISMIINVFVELIDCPLDFIEYHLNCEFVGEELRFFSRIGWKISEMGSLRFSAMEQEYECDTKSFDSMEYFFDLERMTMRDEPGYFWMGDINELYEENCIQIFGNMTHPVRGTGFWVA